ncbi:MAG: transposase [Gallionella sp.]|nr:transposase [Gallionella sp.]
MAILSVVMGKGQQHDFSVFKDSRLLLHPDALLLADSGYQGIHKHHQNSNLPIKKKKGQPLSAEDKAYNKILSKQRVFIEHINRRCKIFRIVKNVYRGKHKHYSLTWNLVAALVNLRYGCI